MVEAHYLILGWVLWRVPIWGSLKQNCEAQIRGHGDYRLPYLSRRLTRIRAALMTNKPECEVV